MVRGFVREKAIARLAIVIADDPRQPRQVRVAFADRGAVHDNASIADPRLAKLVAAAEREWSTAQKPMFKVFGRPWPLPVLVAGLSVELLSAALEAPRDRLPHDALDFAEMALIALTAVMLWRQVRVGYVLAIALSAVQFVQPIVVDVPFIPSVGVGTVTVWLLLSWSYPALIWLCVGLLYRWRRRRSSVTL
jgi:hypothetical protein